VCLKSDTVYLSSCQRMFQALDLMFWLRVSMCVCVCVCVCVRVSEGETERIENISPSLK